MTTILYYDSTGSQIVRQRTYATRDAVRRALARAAKRGQMAAIAHRRTDRDQPTCHH